MQRVDRIHGLLNKIFLIFSPFAILGFLLAMIMLADGYGTHARYLDRLEKFGQVAQGRVDFAVPENDWIHVEYADAGGAAREGWLRMKYYPESRWEPLTPGTAVEIRYLPQGMPGQEDVVLEAALDEVRGYRGYLKDPLTVALICWIILIISPQFLYVGLVDSNWLFNTEKPA